MRRTVILEEMFRQVCTPSELRKYNELYDRRNKGSATVLALRVIKDHWDLMIAKRDKVTPLPDSEKPSRMIKINGGGRSWFESL